MKNIYATKTRERPAIKNIVLIFTGLLFYGLGVWGNYIGSKGFTQEMFVSLNHWGELTCRRLVFSDIFYLGFLNRAFSIGDLCLFISVGLICSGLILQYKRGLK